MRVNLSVIGDCRDEDGIGLVEDVEEAREFVGVVVPVDLQVEVAAIQAAERRRSRPPRKGRFQVP